MASTNQRDAGRDFEGNGPSSFDARDFRVEPADVAPLSPETVRIIREAEAHCEAAFGPGNPHHAKWSAFYAERARMAVAA